MCLWAVARSRPTIHMAEGVRPPAFFKHLVGLVSFGVLLGAAFTTEAAPSSNVAYRRIDVQDAATGELFPAALWYPTRAAPAPLFLTGSLSRCRLPAMLCGLIAFEMRVANNAPPADGKFGFIVISHGAGGLSLNHRDLAVALASHGYVVAAPTHPRGKDNDISGVGVWVGRPKQVSRVIDALLKDGELGSHIQPERIGVVGHSNGGYTALAVAGAKPSLAAIVAHCRQHPDDSKFCSYGGAATREATRKVGDIPDVRDPRVRAIVLMAPNTAPFTDDALAQVAVPVRVYGAERDDLTLVRYHAERLAKALPSQTEYVLVQRAGHFLVCRELPWDTDTRGRGGRARPGRLGSRCDARGDEFRDRWLLRSKAAVGPNTVDKRCAADAVMWLTRFQRWVSLPRAHWTTAAFGGVALLTAAGLLRHQGWAKPLAYPFAAALALSWIYAVWQVSHRGWAAQRQAVRATSAHS
jgi:predicted dienelactone hydrolase